MTTSEAEARKTEEKRRAQEKSASKFRPFSSFSAGNKARNRSFDEDSPGSSKRYVLILRPNPAPKLTPCSGIASQVAEHSRRAPTTTVNTAQLPRSHLPQTQT